MKYILIVIMLLGLSCKTSKILTVEEIENLGTNFKVEKIEEFKAELTTKLTLTLDFEKNKIAGFAGCNNYNGTIITKGNQIKFEDLVATKMFCNNMKTEEEFLKKLTTITSFDIKNNQFLLLDKAEVLVMTCAISK